MSAADEARKVLDHCDNGYVLGQAEAEIRLRALLAENEELQATAENSWAARDREMVLIGAALGTSPTLDSICDRATELKDLRDDYSRLIGRQGDLLTGAVNALRGDPPPLTTWSHHDVADLARAVIAERDEARVALAARDSVIRQVRELHTPMEGEWCCEDDDCETCQSGDSHEGDVCSYCFGYDSAVYAWPCPTVRILDAGGDRG